MLIQTHIDREVSPKLAPSGESGRAAWFKYYAGFSQEFAQTTIHHLASPGDRILDPWNGSGTTTYAASLLRISSVGVDANPAMVLAARAREISVSKLEALKAQLEDSLTSFDYSLKRKRAEPLDAWFSPTTSNRLRGLLNHLLEKLGAQTTAVETFSPEQAFVFVAMAKVLRAFLREFVGSNPTWIRVADEASRVKVQTPQLIKKFRETLSILVAAESQLGECPQNLSEVSLGSSLALGVESDSINLVLTSPPYCTRIDYARATLPELALLGMDFRSQQFKTLRKTLLGTTTVPKEHPMLDEAWGATCCSFLEAMSQHTSLASSVYYLKNHLQYFAGLYQSIGEIHRVLVNRGNAVIVVQDSYYKEIHNNLPRIVTEMAKTRGLTLIERHDVQIKRTKAIINPGARGYRNSFEAVESVLQFRKELT